VVCTLRDHTDHSDLQILNGVAGEIHAAFNDNCESGAMVLVDELTGEGIALEVMRILADCFTEIEWMVSANLTKQDKNDADADNLSQGPPSAKGLLKSEVYSRLQTSFEITVKLLATPLSEKVEDELLKNLIRIYKLLNILLKSSFAAAKAIVGVKKADRCFPDRPLHRLVVELCTHFTPNVYEFLGMERDAWKHATLRKMPELVHVLEQFDCSVIEVGKWCNDEQLTSVVQHSTARDFKIEVKQADEHTEAEPADAGAGGKPKRRRKK